MTKRAKASRRGQGMTEYIIIAALIAVATIGIVTTFGNNIRGIFNGSSSALAGNTNVSSGDVKPTRESGKRGLDDFGWDNQAR